MKFLIYYVFVNMCYRFIGDCWKKWMVSVSLFLFLRKLFICFINDIDLVCYNIIRSFFILF